MGTRPNDDSTRHITLQSMLFYATGRKSVANPPPRVDALTSILSRLARASSFAAALGGDTPCGCREAMAKGACYDPLALASTETSFSGYNYRNLQPFRISKMGNFPARPFFDRSEEH